jgi:hypothetical protein
MTDNEAGTSVGLPPALTRNIRAELARAGRSARQAQEAIGIPGSTWDDRMVRPGYWRLGQLQALADWLGVELADLVRSPR